MSILYWTITQCQRIIIYRYYILDTLRVEALCYTRNPSMTPVYSRPKCKQVKPHMYNARFFNTSVLFIAHHREIFSRSSLLLAGSGHHTVTMVTMTNTVRGSNDLNDLFRI